MYIAAGKLALENAKIKGEELRLKAIETGLVEDAQKYKDYADSCNNFEKRLYDLELTRTIFIQQMPQIRMIQTSNIELYNKIDSSIKNTIPLWKSQIVVALALNNAEKAAKAEKGVNDLTNELLLNNAKLLHTNSVEIAKESERGIVDIEVLKKVNGELITSLSEVMQIRKDGAAKRAQATKELEKIENDLKSKLIEMSAVDLSGNSRVMKPKK